MNESIKKKKGSIALPSVLYWLSMSVHTHTLIQNTWYEMGTLHVMNTWGQTKGKKQCSEGKMEVCATSAQL